MDVLLIINGIACLVFFLFFMIKYFEHNKKDSKKRALSVLFKIVFIYFIFSSMFFVWFFGIFDYSIREFLLIYLIGLIFQTILFFRLGYVFNNHKKFYIIAGLYAGINLLLLFRIELFLTWGFFLSFIVMMFFFSQIIFLGKDYKKLGLAGVCYSFVSLVFSVLIYLNIGNPLMFFLISFGFFFYFTWIFFDDIEKYSFSVEEVHRNKFLVFLNHIVFIIIIVNFIFISTIVIHEFGHYGVSSFYDCEKNKIVYEDSFFHAETYCVEKETEKRAIWGGILLPYIIALACILFGERFMKDVGLLIMGFNSVSLSKDLALLDISNSFVFLSILIGIVFLIWGIWSFIHSRVDVVLFY
ncbi:MAG: hypothetical protein ACOC1P_06360 [Minisyncoccales bacterium]